MDFKKMKIFCTGSVHWCSQLPRIEDGFRQLGHEITPHTHEADLLYSNDSPHYKQIVIDKLAGRIRGKIIFTVLDLPFHVGAEFDYEGLERELAFADAICTISEYVQWQVKTRLNRDTTVIYQPVKPITRFPTTGSNHRFLSVGRRFDPNKRSSLWTSALQILGVSPNQIALVGNEGGWGDYQGVLDDERLNAIYNSVDFVMACGKIEGLSLCVPEAMAAGIIPVVCADLTTREELLPPTIFPEYSEVEPTAPSIASFIARYLNNSEAMAEMKKRLHKHYLDNWAEKTSGIGVARRILDVYKTL